MKNAVSELKAAAVPLNLRHAAVLRSLRLVSVRVKPNAAHTKSSGGQFSKLGAFRGIVAVVFPIELARRAVHSFQKTGLLTKYRFEILLKIRLQENQDIMSGQPGIHRGKP